MLRPFLLVGKFLPNFSRKAVIGLFFILTFPSLAGSSLNLHSITIPAKPGSAYFSLWAEGDTLYMSWITAHSRHKGEIYVASYRQGSWSEPKQVYASEQLFINWADFPKLAISGDLMVLGWPEKIGSGTYDYGLRFVRSTDRGKTFNKPAWLHEHVGPGEHGFLSMAPLPGDRVMAAWLDGRAMGSGESAHGHGSGHMQLRTRVINKDNLGPELLVDDATCECCGTAIASQGDQLWLAYRDKSQAQIRDVFMARGGAKGWEKGKHVAGDQWMIHGCPVNGPALAASSQRLALAWFSGKLGGHAYLSVSEDGGEQFKDILLSKDSLGRMDVALLLNHHIAVLWVEPAEDHSTVHLAIFHSEKGAVKEISRKVLGQMDANRDGGFPRMVAFQKGLMVAMGASGKAGIRITGVELSQD